MALTIVCGGCAGSSTSSKPAAPAVTSGPETEESHADKPNRVVTLTDTRVVPRELDMGTGDVLAIHNLSVQTFQLTFLEPKHVGQYTTCTLIKRVSPTEATARGAVFQRQGDQVTATLLPGTFVSICSLKPGVYVYTAQPLVEGSRFGSATLGMKGTIVVK